jgi:hypothetical protein
MTEKTVAENALRHGAGGYHIHAGRIGYAAGEVDFTKVQRQQNSDGTVAGAFGASALIGTEIMTYKPEGRWPSNLLLNHLTSCVQDGMKEEAGYTINRWDDGAKPFGDGAGHSYTGGQINPTLVEDWKCMPGCPVNLLDGQDNKAVRCFKQLQ